MLLFSLLFSFSTQVLAEKPECTADHITRKCEFFKDNQEKEYIELDNGTRYGNPLFKPLGYTGDGTGVEKADSKSSPSEISKDANNDDFEDTFSEQAEIIEMLDGTSISIKNRMTIGVLGQMATMEYGRFPVTWPLDKKSGKKEEKNEEEILNAVKNFLSEEKFNALKEKIESSKARAVTRMQAYKSKELQRKNKQRENEKKAAGSKLSREQRKAQVAKLFEEARDSVLQVIQKGRQEAELSDDEGILIKKVNDLHFLDPDDPEVINSTNCIGEKNNAQMDPVQSSVALCPEVLFYPDAAIIAVLGHEISHSIDPCWATMPVWRVDKEQLKKINLAEYDPKIAKDLSRTEKMNIDPFYVYDNEKDVQRLIDQKVLVKVTDGVDKDKYPFQSESNCFTKNYGFREINEEDLRFNINFLTARTSPPDESDKAIRKRYFDAMVKHPQCMSMLTHRSQMGEVMCDMFGALALEKFSTKKPFKNEAEKATSNISLEILCRQQSQKIPESFSPHTLTSQLPNLFQKAHPHYKSRMNKILLNLPGMEKAYDCKRKVPACFDHLSLVKRSTAGAEKGTR